MRVLEHPAVILILVLLVVVVFGSKRLPDMARNLGRSGRILKAEADELKNDTKTSYESEEKSDFTYSPEPIEPIREVKPLHKRD